MIPTMNRENRLLVTDDPVEIEKQLVEVQDLGKASIVSKESTDYTST
jgi:hypothetical protein